MKSKACNNKKVMSMWPFIMNTGYGVHWKNTLFPALLWGPLVSHSGSLHV